MKKILFLLLAATFCLSYENNAIANDSTNANTTTITATLANGKNTTILDKLNTLPIRVSYPARHAITVQHSKKSICRFPFIFSQRGMLRLQIAVANRYQSNQYGVKKLNDFAFFHQ